MVRSQANCKKNRQLVVRPYKLTVWIDLSHLKETLLFETAAVHSHNL